MPPCYRGKVIRTIYELSILNIVDSRNTRRFLGAYIKSFRLPFKQIAAWIWYKQSHIWDTLECRSERPGLGFQRAWFKVKRVSLICFYDTENPYQLWDTETKELIQIRHVIFHDYVMGHPMLARESSPPRENIGDDIPQTHSPMQEDWSIQPHHRKHSDNLWREANANVDRGNEIGACIIEEG
ncbi:hypothetical protein BGX38DRAFT_891402 [Terfezia claveryi]|nr:hypothetical protein BGX38DRAFT_891402 [Terfezia claveryi]